MKLNISKFWIVYLVYYLATCIIILVDIGKEDQALTAFDILESVVIVVGTIGLCGYIFELPILNRLFWRIFCVPFVGVAIYILYRALVFEPADSIGITLATVAMFVLLFGPFAYALINYAFFREHLWVHKTQNDRLTK